MIGIIITAYNDLGSSLIRNVKRIVKEDIEVTACDFMESDNDEILKFKLKLAIDKYSGCDEIFILSDIFGATPFNTAAKLATENPKIKVISGVCTAMVIYLVVGNKDKYFLSEVKEDTAKQMLEKKHKMKIISKVHDSEGKYIVLGNKKDYFYPKIDKIIEETKSSIKYFEN